jgi:two-component system, LytTR family, response regulator
MLRAIIIDDEQRGINALKVLIDRFVNDVKVVAESTNAHTAIDLIENYAPDIVFLDIKMPDMDGFELLEKLKWKNFNLIFTTAYEEYGLRALKSNAVDYLLKPIDYEDLKFSIDKVKERISEQESRDVVLQYKVLLDNLGNTGKNKIVISSKWGVESIDVNDIIHLESKSNYTQICLSESRTILTSKTLKEFDHQLCASYLSFMRVHHSFIVNLNKVARYLKQSDNIVMVNQHEIPLAKSRKGIFFKWLSI